MVDLLTTSEGICQTRRELFGQLFEELIRQEMINCKVNQDQTIYYSWLNWTELSQFNWVLALPVILYSLDCLALWLSGQTNFNLKNWNSFWISLKEKGLLLLRIRTELKQTLMSYQVKMRPNFPPQQTSIGIVWNLNKVGPTEDGRIRASKGRIVAVKKKHSAVFNFRVGKICWRENSNWRLK